MQQIAAAETQFRVRVWFGTTAVADYTGDKQTAEHYAVAMGHRFRGLGVTIDPVGVEDASTPIRGRRLWVLTP